MINTRKRLWIYVLAFNHPSLNNRKVSKMGQHVCNTYDEAIKYATNETLGKGRGLVNAQSVVYCRDHTEHALENGFICSGSNYYDKYDDFLRENNAMPDWNGVITNDMGGGSREIHVHGQWETLTDITFKWITAMVEVLSSSNSNARDVYKAYFYKLFIEEIFFDMLIRGLHDKKKLDFALDLAARFGKTSWMITTLIRLFKKHDYKLCVLPSYWLSSLSSFKKELFKWEGFDDEIVIFDKDSNLEDVIKEYYGKKMIVIEASLHLPNFKNHFKLIRKLPSSEKITMIDEADFGAWKSNQKELVDFLDCSLNIYLSGTGLDKITSNLENLDDRIIQFTYTEMLLVQSGEHPLFFD